jgi:hypothetical protein
LHASKTKIFVSKNLIVVFLERTAKALLRFVLDEERKKAGASLAF